MVIFSQIDRVRLTLGHLQLAWMGFPSKLLLKDKSPPSTRNLGVGFYFLLLIILMYVNRATINVLKRIMIVIASSILMAYLLSKGNHDHPRFNCTSYYTICIQLGQEYLFGFHVF
jgi:hypothetical protein